MKTFDPRNVQCPYCGKAKLRAIEDSGRVLLYICHLSCGSVFDRGHFIDFKKGIIYYLAKRRNPDYISKLDSDDVLQNLEKTAELDQMRVPFHIKTYIIGSRSFDESE